MMPDYQTFDFSPQTPITVVPFPKESELSDDDHFLIEAVWEEEMRRLGSKLFNGKLFSLISWDQHHMTGSFVDYKLYLAQIKKPQLTTVLNIRPLSISGLTRSGNRILLAQRSSTVTQDPLRYELAPSGGIDPSSLVGNHIDIKKQFILELEEETGLKQETIEGIHPFALIWDRVSQVMEICAEIIVSPNAEENIKHPIDEYIQFFWVPETELSAFTSKYREEFVPMSLYILHLKQLI